MPMVVNNHQRIFFRFEGERGAFLMLHHDLLGSHQDWYRAGYVEELAKEFRLVIPDARGHGRSDRPSEKEAYQPAAFAEDMLEIMNGLGIRNLHFLGYGLGAQIGLEMLRRYPERVRIAVLGGESPLMLPAVREHWRTVAAQLENGTLAALVAELRAQERLVRYADSDPPEEDRAALLALLQALSEWEPHGEDRVSVTSPVTLFTGGGDPAAERVERARAYVNRARLVQFPGMSHAKLFEERAQITQELVRLLKSGRREDGDGPHRQQRGESSEGRAADSGGNQRQDERRADRQDARPSDRRDDRRERERREDGPRDFRRPYQQSNPPNRDGSDGRSGGLEAAAPQDSRQDVAATERSTAHRAGNGQLPAEARQSAPLSPGGETLPEPGPRAVPDEEKSSD